MPSLVQPGVQVEGSSVSLGANSSVGTTLIAYMADYSSDTALTPPSGFTIVPNSTDANSNYGSWTAIARYEANPGGLKTFTMSGGSGDVFLRIEEWPACTADQGGNSANASGSFTSFSATTNGNLSGTNELGCACFISDHGTATAESGYTLGSNLAGSPGQFITETNAAVGTSGSPLTASVSFSSSTSGYAGSVATFKFSPTGTTDNVSGSVASASTLAGSVSARKELSGSSSSTTGLTSAPTSKEAVNAALSAGSQVNAVPHIAVAVSGSITAASTISGVDSKTTGSSITGTVQDQTALTAAVKAAVAETASSAPASQLAGTLSEQIALTGSISAASQLAGTAHGGVVGVDFVDWDDSINTSPANSVTVPLLGGGLLQTTDVIFAHVYWDGATAPDVPAAPSGWTLIGSSDNAGLKNAVYWGLGSTPTPTFDFAASGTPTACYSGVEAGAYRGIDNTTPYTNQDYSVVFAGVGTGSPVASNQFQVQNQNWAVIGFVPYSVSNFTFSTPSGLTQRASSSPMAWFDSDGQAAGSNQSVSTTASATSTWVGFALSLNPAGAGLGTPSAEFTLLGQNLGYSSITPTITNSLGAIPAGAILRLRASDTGFTGLAGSVSSPSGGGLTWSQLNDSGDQVNGSNHIRQSVWGAVASSAIASSGLTVSMTHTPGTSGNSSLDLGMITSSLGVDVSASEDSAQTDLNQSAGVEVTSASPGDLVVSAIMGYATDAGGNPVAAGKLQTLVGLSSPTTNPPVQTWVVLDGPSGSGTNVLEVNWGNTNGATAPYTAYVEAFSPVSVVPLTGSISSQSDLSGTASALESISGSVEPESSLTSTPTVVESETGSLVASAAVEATPAVQVSLISQVQDSTALTGTIKATEEESGIVSAETSLEATPAIGIDLTGSILSLTQIEATESQTSGNQVTGGLEAKTSLGSTPSVVISVEGSIVSGTDLSAEPKVSGGLTGSLEAESEVSASVTESSGTGVDGSIPAETGLQATPSVAISLEGTISAGSALASELSEDFAVEGQISSASELSGDSVAIYWVVGTIETVTGLTSAIESGLRLEVQGSIQATSEAQGELAALVSLIGELAAQSVLIGQVVEKILVSGTISTDISMTAALKSKGLLTTTRAYSSSIEGSSPSTTIIGEVSSGTTIRGG